jgi:uncharacterized protein (DUF736 family)
MALRDIGGLYKGKEGSKMLLSGSIDFLGDRIRIGIFKNDRKEKDSHPDYRICRVLDDDKPSGQSQASAPVADQEDLPF